MSRLSAWIASRRQARRTERALHASAVRGVTARPLRFERYEERIALSTNVAVDFPLMEPYVFNVDHIDVREGGFIKFSSRAGDYTYILSSGFSSSLKAASETAYYRGFAGSNLEATTSLSSIWAEPAFDGFDYAFTDGHSFGDGDSPEVLATDSRVVPIPPPMSNPVGNEGGHIAMTPFMGPATLGLPSAGDSLYASGNRASLPSESIETSTKAPTATPADMLRGRAVVYEVAHTAGELNADRARLGDSETTLAKLDLNGVWNVADGLDVAPRGENAVIAARRVAVSFNKPNENDDAVAMKLASSDDLAARQLTEAELHDRDGAEGDVGADAAANDAAFEQWQNELAPAFDAPEVGVATADMQQRRVLGAALAVLGAIPVTKAMRRRSRQESLAPLTRERRAVPPVTLE